MRFGRYELLERVAMGGMAEVFRARTTGPDGFSKEVCIKRILPQFCGEEDFVRMFIDEAQLAARLQHANIVQIFDFDQVDGAYFIAMEYVRGQDLRGLLRAADKSGRPPGPYRSAMVVAEICKGLHHAHNKDGLGLVHRDVSPHNVLVSDAGEVKVMDFGIAKAADRITRTSTGIIKGKVAYMAPEQAAGGDLDHRVDQFATGLVLYEMLTLRRAFDGPEPVALRRALNGEVEPPSLLVPDLPPELDEIFLRATARAPADRYPDMRALERALMQFIYRRAPDDDELDLAAWVRALAPASQRPKTQVMSPPPGPDPAAPTGISVQVSAAQPAAATDAAAAGAPTAVSLPSQPVAATATSLPSVAPPDGSPDATRTLSGTPGGLPAAPTTSQVLADVEARPPRSPLPLAAAVVVGFVIAGTAVGFGLRGTPAAAPLAAGPSVVETVPPPTAPAPSEPPPRPQVAQPEPVAAAVAPTPPASTVPTTAAPAQGDQPAQVERVRVAIRGGATWAQVWLKGRMLLSETPGVIQLEPGRHVLLFKNPESGAQKHVTVTVTAGKATVVRNPL